MKMGWASSALEGVLRQAGGACRKCRCGSEPASPGARKGSFCASRQILCDAVEQAQADGSERDRDIAQCSWHGVVGAAQKYAARRPNGLLGPLPFGGHRKWCAAHHSERHISEHHRHRDRHHRHGPANFEIVCGAHFAMAFLRVILDRFWGRNGLYCGRRPSFCVCPVCAVYSAMHGKGFCRCPCR